MTDIDALGLLAAAKIMGTANLIAAQEAIGQRDIGIGSVIPVERNGITDDQLRELGFTLYVKIGTKALATGDMLQSCALPAGWSIKPSEESSLWSYIHDTANRKRFSIFYKAAFYDRRASMNPARRFSVGTDWNSVHQSEGTRNYTVVLDCDRIIMRFSGVLAVSKCENEISQQDWEALRDERVALEAAATEWLNREYPDHKNFMAYWDMRDELPCR